MADSEDDVRGVTIQELGRQLRDVLVRFEGLVRRVEDKFVTKEVFDLRVAVTEQKAGELQTDIDGKIGKTEFEDLARRVRELEGDKVWLNRLIYGALALAILGLVISVGGVPK